MFTKKPLPLSLWVLVASIAVFAFYLTVTVLVKDVYEFAVVGAIFELLSLPMLALLALLLIYHVVAFFTGHIKASPKIALASFAFSLATLLVLLALQ